MENLYLGVTTAKKWLTTTAIVVWFFALILANVLEHSGLQFFCILLSVVGFVGGITYIIFAGVTIQGVLRKIEDKKNGNRYVSEMTSAELIWAKRLEKFGDWLASKNKSKVK